MVPDVLPDCTAFPVWQISLHGWVWGENWLAVFPCFPQIWGWRCSLQAVLGFMVAKIKQAFAKVKRTGSPCHAVKEILFLAFSCDQARFQRDGVTSGWSHLCNSANKVENHQLGRKSSQVKMEKKLQAVDHGSTEFTRNQGGSKALTCFPPAGRRRSPSSSVWLNTRDPWGSPIIGWSNPDDGVTLTNNKFKLI